MPSVRDYAFVNPVVEQKEVCGKTGSIILIFTSLYSGVDCTCASHKYNIINLLQRRSFIQTKVAPQGLSLVKHKKQMLAITILQTDYKVAGPSSILVPLPGRGRLLGRVLSKNFNLY